MKQCKWNVVRKPMTDVYKRQEYPKVGTLVFFALCLNIRKILEERQKSGKTATEKEKSPYWLQGCNSKGGEVTVY